MVLEITPVARPETAVMFGSIARNLGLRHATIAGSAGDFNDPVTVSPSALRGMMDLLLADVDGRTPTRRALTAAAGGVEVD